MHGPEWLGLSGAVASREAHCGVLVWAGAMCTEEAGHSFDEYSLELCWGGPFSPLHYLVFIGQFGMLALLVCIEIS